jgi:hypothetical protein
MDLCIQCHLYFSFKFEREKEADPGVGTPLWEDPNRESDGENRLPQMLKYSDQGIKS